MIKVSTNCPNPKCGFKQVFEVDTDFGYYMCPGCGTMEDYIIIEPVVLEDTRTPEEVKQGEADYMDYLDGDTDHKNAFSGGC